MSESDLWYLAHKLRERRLGGEGRTGDGGNEVERTADAERSPMSTSPSRVTLAYVEELEQRLRMACEPCADCGHIDYRELDDCLDREGVTRYSDWRPPEVSPVSLDEMGLAELRNSVYDRAIPSLNYSIEAGTLLALIDALEVALPAAGGAEGDTDAA